MMWLRPLVIVLACAMPMSVVRAQQPQTSAADTREIADYRLTAAGLKKVAIVNRALVQEMRTDPKLKQSLALRAEMEALSRKDDLSEAEEQRLQKLEEQLERLDDEVNPLGGDATSLAEMEARIKRFPPLTRALEREGMSAREYATFWLAFMQAAFVHGFQASGMLKEVPSGVNMENVRFISAHQEEIEAMQRELEALGRTP